MTCSSFSGLDCTLLLVAYGMLNTGNSMVSRTDSPVFALACGFLCRAVDTPLAPEREKEGVVGSEEIVFLSYGSSSVVNSFQHPQGQL